MYTSTPHTGTQCPLLLTSRINVCYGPNCIPLKCHTLNVTVFGYGALERELCLTGLEGWGPPDGISPLIRRDARGLSHHVRTREKAAVCQLGRKLSPEPGNAGTLTSEFRPPELRKEISVFCFGSPGCQIQCGTFVTINEPISM